MIFVLVAARGAALAFVSVTDFGAVGDGSDATAAIQAAVNSVGSSSDTIYIPAGTYAISAPIVITNTRGVRIVGDGIYATKLQPTAAVANQAVLHFINDIDDAVESLSIFGLTGNAPAAGIQTESVAGNFATHLTVTDVEIGSSTPNSIVDGIKFSAATASADYNNELGIFENVVITNFSHSGYSFLHSNALCHNIIGGTIANGPIGVLAETGSFKMVGTHLENLSDVDFDFENPMYAGEIYQHPIQIGDVSSDGGQAILRTGTTGVMVSITGMQAHITNVSAPLFNVQAPYSMLMVSNSWLYRLNNGSELDFVGGSNQVINFTGNYIGVSHIVVNGRFTSEANCWTGKPKLTAASGSAIVESGDVCGTFTSQPKIPWLPSRTKRSHRKA